MGKAAKAIDDGFVALGEVQGFGVAELSKQLDGSRLRRGDFGVLKGHVKEHLPRRFEPLIETPVDRMLGDGERRVVGGKSTRIAAKHVTGKLVENDDGGKASVRGREPVWRHP